MLARTLLFLMLYFGLTTCLAQSLNASVSLVRPAVSDTLVRHFISRAMTMQGYNELAYDARKLFANWAVTAGTRFAGRIGGFWYTPETSAQEASIFDTLQHNTGILHQLNPNIVVQGAVFEIVFSHVSNLQVPNTARAVFGEDTIAIPRRNFRFADMMYPSYFNPVDTGHFRWDNRPPGEAPGVPDMSQTETQLWFYYCAQRQIDAGCEAIHFGQVMLMDKRDVGHKGWWNMLQLVRSYARTRNRGFVLCDAHTHGQYYDPDSSQPLPDSLRQLLFDFHSFPLRAVENDTISAGAHGAHLEVSRTGEGTGAIFRRSKAGVAPGGWKTQHLPVLIELDNWGVSNLPGKPKQWPYIWGLDEISWFATQPSAYRNQWLIYADARIQQIDPDAYLQMPGLRGIESPPSPSWLYRADLFGQADIIPAIWSGATIEQAKTLLLIGPVEPVE